MVKWKRLYKESAKEPDYIYIKTGLKDGVAKEILDSVVGQMSDGMWENSPAMEHYWRFVDIVVQGKEVALRISTKGEWVPSWISKPGSIHHIENYFVSKMNLDENAIRQFFAKKLKAVAKEELKDEHDIMGWNRNNEMESGYLAGTISDCYFVYETLLGRSGYQRKYPSFMLKDLLA